MNQARMKKRRAGLRGHSRGSISTGPLTVLVTLLSCAFLWPSEGASNGDGLHLSVLWLTGLAGVLLQQRWQMSLDGSEATTDLRHERRAEFLTSADGLVMTGLVVFLLGTWLSTWQVFAVSGDRRAALNLAFDWTAITACACLCRMLAVEMPNRRAVVCLLIGLGVGAAVYGMWQSETFYAAEAETYVEQRRMLDEGGNPFEIARIQQEFARKEIPLAGVARQLYEHRLLNSTEPFGPFALANTLAGVLAVSLVLLCGGLFSEWHTKNRQWKRLIIPLVTFAIIAWCLVLTKSRTAWAGTVVGLAILLWSQYRRRDESSSSVVRTAIRIVLLIVIPAVLLFAVGIFAGTIDKEVLLESPRSLQFRFFYWTGAAGVVAEEPLLGAGPGNFRQLYLAHKPVESSEAILDPHNILLDAWCFAGIAGFVGMLLLVAGIIGSTKAKSREVPELMVEPSGSIAAGLMGCLILHFSWLWLSSGWMPSGQDLLVIVMVVLAGICSIFVGRLPWNPIAPAAAAITLLVHLLGAGGLQITVLGFLLVVLATLSASQSVPIREIQIKPKMGRNATLVAVAVAVMAAATLFWGLIPVLKARVQQGIGQQQLRMGDIEGALGSFELAAAADSLSPTMRQHITQAVTYSLVRQKPLESPQMTSGWPLNDVQRIESMCADSIQSDTRQIGGWLSRARIYHQLYRLTNESQYIKKYVNDLRQVALKHPTNAGFQVELAVGEQAAGEVKRSLEAAKKSREIEAVNQVWGHSDQYLSEGNLKTIDQIINGESQ